MQSPQKIAEKWAGNLSSATNAIRDGINSVTVSPTQKAAAAADQYLMGVQQAVASGAYQRGLNRVSLEDWKRAFLDKGVSRIAQGAVAAKPKMQEFMTEFIPHLQSGQAKLSQIPRGNFDQNLQRMIAMATHNHEFKRSR